jgi:ribose 5-phosphate isomerase A
VSVSEEKRVAGVRAASLVEDGMTVGLGTGSTVAHLLDALAERAAREGLRFRGVCTSTATERRAAELGLETIPLSADAPIDLYIDGADEVDPHGHLVKGGGGALLREKLVADWSRRRVIIVDSAKQVSHLGDAFAVPIEVVRFGWTTVREKLADAGCIPVLREREGTPYLTDEGHFILDCRFPGGIVDPMAMAGTLKQVVGVVETGLFIGYCHALIIGRGSDTELLTFH